MRPMPSAPRNPRRNAADCPVGSCPARRPAPRNFVPVLIAAGLLVGIAAWFLLRRPGSGRAPAAAIPVPVAGRTSLGTLEVAGAPKREFYTGDGVKGRATLDLARRD